MSPKPSLRKYLEVFTFKMEKDKKPKKMHKIEETSNTTQGGGEEERKEFLGGYYAAAYEIN